MASTRSLRGLDWVNFFVANVQTGFGPFIAVYLTSQAWTQEQIGFALSVGTVTAMLSQVPAGALVDAIDNKRAAAVSAILAVTCSALLFAIWPVRLLVFIAEVLHGFASCMLSPAIAAISLVLVGRAALGERLGRNASYASIGNGVAAAVMGACGTYVSDRSVFWLTAALAAPGLLALQTIGHEDVMSQRHREAHERDPGATAWAEIRRLLLDRRLLVFAACCVLFHLSNAAMLPLAGTRITRQVGSGANLVIAACIVVPQLIVAVLSPFAGRLAGTLGRKPLLIAGFAALPLRGLLFALVANPYGIVAVQALDGVSGTVFGLMLPLIAADVTRGTNRFNLCMGMLGIAVGIGATVSTSVAGVVAERYGGNSAFLALGAAGLLSVLLVAFAMPETRPANLPEDPQHRDAGPPDGGAEEEEKAAWKPSTAS
jgi:MFS family permease